MLQRASVLLGLAILLSLLFPLKMALQAGGVDPLALPLTGVDLTGVGVLLAVLPAVVLCRHGQLAARIPRWNLWLALLALVSLLFLVLHVSWTREFVTEYVRQAVAADGSLPLLLSYRRVMDALDLATELGVLFGVVGVLVNLHAVPDPDAPTKPRRKK
jgi:hypothetical protein